MINTIRSIVLGLLVTLTITGVALAGFNNPPLAGGYVDPGVANQIAYYATTGNHVRGNSATTVDGSGNLTANNIKSITSYGAVCDGSTDDSAAFQSAATHGGIISIPANVSCNIANTVTIAKSVIFQGNGGAWNHNGTIINCRTGTTDCFQINNTNATGVWFRDFTFDGTGQTNGSLINWIKADASGIERVFMSNAYRCQTWGDINTIYTNNSQCQGPTGDYANKWYNSVANPQSNQLFFNDYIVTCNGGNTTTDGLVWDGYSVTITASSLVILNCHNGMNIQNSAGDSAKYPLFFQCVNCIWEGNNTHGIYAQSIGVFEVTNSDCHGTSGDSGCLAVLSDSGRTATIKWHGGQIYGSGVQCLLFNGLLGTFDMVNINSCSLSSSHTYAAVTVQANASNVQFIGGQLGDSNSKYGLETVSGAANIQITDPYINGNATAAINDGANAIYGSYSPTANQKQYVFAGANKMDYGITQANHWSITDNSTDGIQLFISNANNSTGRAGLSIGNLNSGGALTIQQEATGNVDITNFGSGNLIYYAGTNIRIGGTLRFDSTTSANGTAGVSCSGAPTASFASVNGLVTHC